MKDPQHNQTAPLATENDEARPASNAGTTKDRERALAAELAQARRQAALFRRCADLGATLDQDELSEQVLEIVTGEFPAHRAMILLVDEERGVLRGGRSTGPSPETAAAIEQLEIPLTEAGGVLAGEPLLLSSDDPDPDAASLVKALQIRSGLIVPLQDAGQPVGVLAVGSTTSDRPITPEDHELLLMLGRSAAVALGNAQLYSKAQQRVAAFEVLRRTSLQLTSSLDLSTALDTIAESALTLVGASDCLIYLCDEASQRFALGTALGKWAESGSVLSPRPSGLTVSVAREGHPVVINDAIRHPLYASPEAQQWNIQAIAGFPLQRTDRLLGVLHVAFVEPHTFSEQEVRVLGLLADQAAIAIENARLFEAERAQLAELTVLHAVAIAGAEATQEDVLIERVTHIIGETLYPADLFGVFLLDETARVLHVHPSYAVMERRGDRWQAIADRLTSEGAGRIVVPVGQGITGTVAASGEPRRVGDVTQVPEYIDAGVGTRSELCVPLKVGERVMGVINAESPQLDAFSEADERLLVTVAGQLATAIEKVRLYEAAQQEIAERKRAAEALRRLQEFNAGIVQNMAEGIVMDDAEGTITFVNPAAATMFGYETEELIGEHWTTLIPPDQWPISQAANERRARGHSDRYEIQTVRLDGTRLPVQVSGSPRFDPNTGRFAGTLAVFTDLTERVRAEEELRKHRDHLEELVDERTAALTEANAQLQRANAKLAREINERMQAEAERERLLAAERAQGRRQAALLRLSAELAATLDEAEVCRRVVDGLRDTLGYDFVALFLVDEATGDRHLAASVGFDEPPAGIPAGQGLSERPLLDGQLHYTPDVAQDPRYFYGMGGSEVDVPVRIGGEVRGALVAENKQTHAFSEDDFEVLTAATQQAGLAIENARLFDQAQREIAERRRAEEELRTYQEHLEDRVQERTAELRKSEERYRTLFDGVPVGLYRSTPAGQLLDANPALVQMLDFRDRETLLAVHAASSYLDPRDRVRWQALMEREGVVRDFEYQIRRPDGTVIWANDTARAVQDERGQVKYYEGSLEDITERKRAEEELRRYQEHLEELVEERTAELRASEERYRTLFDGVPVGLYRSTRDGQILDANLAMLQMFGYTDREQAMREIRATDVYVDPAGRSRWQALMEREGVVRNFEVQLRQRDGTVMWVSDAARVVQDEEGQVKYYEGTMEDITQRKTFEAELRRQKDYFEALFVNNPVAVVTGDLDNNVLSWNPMAEKLFGYTQAEAIGKQIDELLANDDSIRAEAAGYTDQVLNLGRVQATTKRTRKDGSLVEVELLALPLVMAGELTGFIGIYYDISELQKARREAEAANQAKSTFLANMSHELRTPLNAIIGFTRLVKRRSQELLPQKQLDNLDKVLLSADHLLGLINAVLDLSKIEAGRVDVQPTTFNLESLVDVCLRTVQPLVKREQVSLMKEVEADLPPLFTDQDKVRQILINLLSNAARFTEDGTVTVSARRRGDLVDLAVADTGIGIPEEALERIFEAFQQVDTSTTRRYGGTGLGLSISRNLAQLLGGEVVVESTIGVGSTFTVTLPIHYGAAPPIPTAASRPAAPPAAAVSQPEEGPVVLAIDDDPNVIYLLQENLAEAGYRVVGASDGEEGLQQARALKPFAIILDILMSPRDGWQVLHALKADVTTRHIPVIVLSIVDNRELGYRLGAFDYLVKPFDREAILSALSRAVPVQEELQRLELLVVDDDPRAVDLVCQLLEGEPFEVRSASDGQEALDAISQQPPDLILLDLVMPRLDGFGVIARLQQTPQHRDIPIIVLTAKTLTASELAQLQQRVTKVVQKRALRREVLLQELRNALQAYHQQVEAKGLHDETNPGR